MNDNIKDAQIIIDNLIHSYNFHIKGFESELNYTQNKAKISGNNFDDEIKEIELKIYIIREKVLDLTHARNLLIGA